MGSCCILRKAPTTITSLRVLQIGEKQMLAGKVSVQEETNVPPQQPPPPPETGHTVNLHRKTLRNNIRYSI